MTFESRLEAALGQYAERVPVQVDVAGVVRAATASPVRRNLVLGRSSWATWRRLAVVVAVLALAAVVAIVAAQLNAKPIHGGGRLLVGVRTTGWVFEPSLGAPIQIELNPACQLVDGGAQMVVPGRFGTPTRVQPVGGDGTTRRGVTSKAIPGYGGTNSERWSPDGSRYALMRFGRQDDTAPADGPGALMIVSIHDLENPVRQIFEIRGASDFGWSRSSRSIAAIGRNGDRFELLVFDLVGGTQRIVASSAAPIVFSPGGGWTAGDSVIAIMVQAATGYRPALVDIASGSLRMLPDPGGLLTRTSSYAIWAPDGKRAILMGDNRPIAIVDANGAKVSDLQRGTPIYNAAQFQADPWSPDSRHFAMTDGSVLRVLDADGNIVGEVPLPPPVEGYNPPVAWSPDGASIAVADTAREGIKVRILDAADLHEQSSALIPTSLDGALCFQWATPVG